MSLAIYFIIAFVLSFLGTLPIGLITLSITQRTIQNGKKSGIMIALGATVMEFIYTFVALISLDYFTQNADLGNSIKTFAVITFLGLGFSYLFKRSKPSKAREMAPYSYFDFFRGIVVGAMNMLIIPFWVFLGIWLKSNGISFAEDHCLFIFSIGAALGALLAFWGYILLSEFVSKKSELINRYTNKAVGLIFIGLALFQLFQLWS